MFVTSFGFLRIAFVSTVVLGVPMVGQSGADFLSQYKGAAFHDRRYNSGPQRIPGMVMCAHYDLGGEGVAYHESTQRTTGADL